MSTPVRDPDVLHHRVRSLTSGVPLVVGGLAALLLAVVWVAATTTTGLTFHFHPALIAGAPAVALRLVGRRDASVAEIVTATVLGLSAVALGWALFELTAHAPAATFVESQPGGVIGEVVAFALIGALLGARWSRGR